MAGPAAHVDADLGQYVLGGPPANPVDGVRHLDGSLKRAHALGHLLSKSPIWRAKKSTWLSRCRSIRRWWGPIMPRRACSSWAVFFFRQALASWASVVGSL